METKGFLLQNPFPLLGKWTKPSVRDIRDILRWSPAPAKPTPVRMISVIIPAHNEEAYLERTLEALGRQNYGWFEVIVVANGCTDRTAEVARGRCHRLIVLSQKGLGVARNLGARMARGELLLFLDADTTLEPAALQRIAQEFGRDHAAGTLKGCPDDDRLAYRVIYALKNSVHRWALHPGSSGVILCWKDHFVRTGGFDEGLEVRENSHLLKRLKRFGSYKYIGDVAATTSMRRYEQRGVGRVVWLWIKLWCQSFFGDLHQRHYETVR
ncbi:MAG TPA: glycosyltransferase [Candidatus Sulfotelmatobacter sp.]|nr:glycosyltransferase [Candidatus Sulfotelmatobacter sp.]HWI59661.1 glycosyltransferase [Bacillota bacterium]